MLPMGSFSGTSGIGGSSGRGVLSALACRLAHDVAQNATQSAAQAIAIISGTNLFMPLSYEKRWKGYALRARSNFRCLTLPTESSSHRPAAPFPPARSPQAKLDLARKEGDLVYGPTLRDSVCPGDIPDGEEVMAVIALGHRASDPVKPTRKPLDEIAKFF